MESTNKERRRALSPISALRFRRLSVTPTPPSIAEVSVETGAISSRRLSLAERGLLHLSVAELTLVDQAIIRISERKSGMAGHLDEEPSTEG